MNDCKKLALESIILSMAEIRNNLKNSALAEDVEVNSKAMLQLAEAFEIINRSYV